MQGSLWKTVAVVGVIGIGGLAILEVQKRLEIQNAQIEPGDAEKLAEEILSKGEDTVTADLTDSAFDKMMADVASSGGELEAGQFASAQLNQPAPAEETIAAYNPPLEFGPDTADSNPVAPQPNMPVEVNTTVSADAIAGGNPFEEPSAVVAANLKSVPEESGIQPAGFQEEPAFAADQAFQRDDQPAVAESAAPATAAGPSATPDTSSPMMLFSAGGNDQPTEPAATLKTVPETEATPFFTEDTAAAAAPESENQTAQFYGNETAEPTEFAPFNDEAVSETAEPAFAPLPVESAPSPAVSDSAPAFAPFPVDTPATPAATPQPELATPSQEIPFVEDVPQSDIPTLEDTSPLTLPSPQPDQTFEIPVNVPEREPVPEPELKPFPTLEPEPTYPRNDSRDFGSSSDDSPQPFTEDLPTPERPATRSFPRNEQPMESAPRSFEPNPVPFPDRNLPDIRPSRESSESREFGPNPRDFTDTPRIEPGRRDDLNSRSDRPSRVIQDPNVRRVSSVMRPNVVLSKEAPDNATVGTPLKYRILVRNDGDATAYEVVVEDEVTSAATVDAASPAATRDRATNRLIWTFDEVAPGETKEIVVKVTPSGEGMLDGVATVKFKSRVKATTVITAPKLQLQMVGPDEVRLGEEVTYRYVITNKGSGEARNVFVRTVLPESGGLKHPAGNDLEYEITSLQPEEQREIVLAVVAAESGEYRAQAEVTAAGGAKDQASWRTNVVGAQLKIDRRGPKRRFVGRSAVYENIISNDTNFDAIDARVTEKIPEGMRFVSASEGGRFDENSRTVTWRLNRIGPGKMTTLKIELMPMRAGPLESVVTVFENAGIQSDDYVSTTQVEDLHNVSADISQLDGPVAVGETFGFTISIDNRGTADATDVELFVDVPPEIQVVGAGSREIPAKLLSGNRVEYRIIVRIGPNEQKDFELKLRGKQALRNGVVKANVRYKQMTEPLVVSESVTIYRDEL